jgi:hypothetical protein
MAKDMILWKEPNKMQEQVMVLPETESGRFFL